MRRKKLIPNLIEIEFSFKLTENKLANRGDSIT
jgi:hypothetical protein